MKNDKINNKMREYAKRLSPTTHERALVAEIYDSFRNLLGKENCIQIGSYPRRTSVTPIKDLDILYLLGSWNENSHDPLVALKNLHSLIEANYVPPRGYKKKVSFQTHSITVEFSDNVRTFSVDIVPAYSYGKNEFGIDMYQVPEVIKRKHAERKLALWESNGKDAWILSDPRGYIEIASQLDDGNDNFRKSVKFVKRWKHVLQDFDGRLKLKSFHVEQIVTKIFQPNSDITMFEAISRFFMGLPHNIDIPRQIPDRANPDKFIDDYLEELSVDDKIKIIKARNGFLSKLDNLGETDSIDPLMQIELLNSYENHSSSSGVDDNKKIFWGSQKGIHVSNTLPSSSIQITPNKPWRML